MPPTIHGSLDSDGGYAPLLPVGYFHLEFTLPGPIADIAHQNKAEIYGLLFTAAVEAALTIAAAGFSRMPTAPRSSTKVHSAAMRLLRDGVVATQDLVHAVENADYRSLLRGAAARTRAATSIEPKEAAAPFPAGHFCAAEVSLSSMSSHG